MKTDLLFNNRELSWLEFNKRVLLQAEDEFVPLMEKLKFLAISSANLDEFFMVRVGGLLDHIAAEYVEKDISGLTSEEQLSEISKFCHNLVGEQSRIYKQLIHSCAKKNIFIIPEREANAEWLESVFHEEIFPVISPITLGPANPFPFLSNLRLTLLVRIKQSDKIFTSLITIPEVLERVYKYKKNGKTYYYTIEEIIKTFLPFIYNGYYIIDYYCFRVTRNADLSLHDEEIEDLLLLIEKYLYKRRKSNVVRLEVDKPLPDDLKKLFKNEFSINDELIYELNHPVDLKFLFSIKEKNPELYYSPITPCLPPEVRDKDLFEYLKNNDLIMYRPYHDFGLIPNLLKKAAHDNNVMSIKLTLYRANNDSQIISALEEAAKKGKHVCVVIELKARFDEQKNVEWAKRLEDAGCVVTYGFLDLKVHVKSLLIVRKEKGNIRRYVHLSTGNYNENTARIYTDIDYLSTSPQLTQETVNLFNYLMGYSDVLNKEFSNSKKPKIITAPVNLRKELTRLIDEEIQNARKGHKSHIIAKVNSIYDREITLKLYEASQAGVKIELIVRGVCSVRPRVKKLSENIYIKSIVGRFLEHPRVLYFRSGEKNKMYISTADWMVRNLDRRVEALVEINDDKSKNFLLKLLHDNLADNAKSWELVDNKYYKLGENDKNHFNYQEYYIDNF